MSKMSDKQIQATELKAPHKPNMGFKMLLIRMYGVTANKKRSPVFEKRPTINLSFVSLAVHH